jgi:hypothetical protein
MRKVISLLIAIVFIMQACSSKSPVIKSTAIKSIVITINDNQHNNASNSKEISNQDSVHSIMEKLNRSEQEPIIFYATHLLKINYSDGQAKTVLCNGSAMKYDGVTYRLKETIGKIVGD